MVRFATATAIPRVKSIDASKRFYSLHHKMKTLILMLSNLMQGLSHVLILKKYFRSSRMPVALSAAPETRRNAVFSLRIFTEMMPNTVLS